MRTLFFLTILAIVGCAGTKGNKGKSDVFNEGSITYKMTMEGNPMASMMGDITMKLYFLNDFGKMEMNMGSMMNMTTIINNKKKEGVMWMSIPMMNQNKAAKMTEEELGDMNEQQANQAPTKVEYDPKTTKTIAGYKCYKAMVEMAGMDEPAEVYITKKLKPNTQGLNMQFKTLEGFPLYYKINQQGITVIMEAEEVSTKAPEKSAFDMKIPDGYEEVEMDELMDGMGGTGL